MTLRLFASVAFVACLNAAPALASDRLDYGLCPAVHDALDPNGDEFFEDADTDRALAALPGCAGRPQGHVHVSRAYLHRRAGERDAARAELALAESAGEPGRAILRLHCQLALDADVRSGDAAATCARLAATAPDWPATHLVEAFRLRMSGEPAASLAAAERGLALAPGQVSLVMARAYALVDLGRRDEALPLLADAARRAPATYEANLAYGRQLYFADREPEALPYLDKAVAVNATSEALRLRGDTLCTLQRYDACFADLDQAVAKAGTWAEPWHVRGHNRSRRGDKAGALADFSRAIELDPKWVSPRIARGILHEEEGRYREALDDYAKASEIEPRNARPWANAASLLIATQRYPEAISAADEAIARDPTSFAAFNNRAFAKVRLERYADAIPDYDRALALKPDNQPSLFWRARAHTAVGRGDLAKRDYGTLIQVNPNYGWAWVNRGAILLAEGDAAGAWRDLDHILPGMRNFGVVWSQWLLAGVGSGQSMQVLARRFNEVGAGAPTSDGWYAVRGVIRLGQPDPSPQDTEAGVADLEQARRLNPDNPIVRQIDAAFQWEEFEDYLEVMADEMEYEPYGY